VDANALDERGQSPVLFDGWSHGLVCVTDPLVEVITITARNHEDRAMPSPPSPSRSGDDARCNDASAHDDPELLPSAQCRDDVLGCRVSEEPQ
jgi:hypothetical protein